VTAPVSAHGRGSPPRLPGDHPELRARVLELLCSPEFEYVSIHDIEVYRARVLEWCRIFAREGLSGLAFPREFGGEHDSAKHVTVFETIAFHDHSFLVKFGVQFGLFAGAIFQLGTRRHHERWLHAAVTLDLPGCFAMTETAHGSNVRDIETTATYLRESDEFEIHTPNSDARKDYIGNAALHGRMAVVFAQLYTQGSSQGVHAFLVPLRDESGRTLPGVQIEDCGWKEGLNGVDNGRILFDHVRVPRENLLNRFGDVASDGTYTSPVASAGRRFFTMLGTLVAGRTAIATAALSAAKSALTVATRYTHARRQFGADGQPERPVLDYLSMQRALLPRLAATCAVHFALQDLKRRLNQSDPVSAQEIEVRAAGLKAWASAHAVETIQACREACGGQGYLEANRLSILRADTDVFTTFEGANAVLLQLVARGLLTEYREEFGDLRLWDVVRIVTGRAATAITELNPIATRRTDADHLRDPDFHLSAFRWREARLLDGLARRLRRSIQDGQNAFDAFAACQDHAQALANAHVERIILESVREGIEQQQNPSAADVLNQLAALFALATLEKNAAWLLEKNYLESPKAAAIREQVNTLCRELRPRAVEVVESFGIPGGVGLGLGLGLGGSGGWG
jgi:acyl-CoA oxidase